MNYEELVERIVSAEQKARAAVETEEARLSSLREDLDREARELTEQYLERARHRIAETEAIEAQNADEELARVQQKLTEDLAQLEARFAAHGAEYEANLLAQILGETP